MRNILTGGKKYTGVGDIMRYTQKSHTTKSEIEGREESVDNIIFIEYFSIYKIIM